MIHVLGSLLLDFVGIYIVANVVAEIYVEVASRKNRASNPVGAVRMLEKLIRLGALVPSIPRKSAQYKLVYCYVNCGQYEEALELIDRLLSKPTNNALQSDLLRMRSECLTGLGRSKEAALNIQDAVEALKNAGENRADINARAMILLNQHELVEAYDVYQRVLMLTPISNRADRAVVLGRLATTAQLCGQGSDILRWSLQLLEETKDPRFRGIGFHMATVGASDTGDFIGAEKYSREGIADALSAKRTEDAAKGMASLASLLNRRPAPDEAMIVIDQGLSLNPRDRLPLLVIKSEILISVGQFENAVKVACEAHDSVSTWIPSERRKLQAITHLAEARAHTMLGDANTANKLIEKAAAVLRDAKMAIWCKAMLLYCAALTSEPQEFRRLLGEVMVGVGEFPDSNDLLTTCYSNAFRASGLLCDWSLCEEYAHCYLGITLFPSDYASVYYYLGLCARATDDAAKAQEYFTLAAQVHPDLYYSKLARVELEAG